MSTLDLGELATVTGGIGAAFGDPAPPSGIDQIGTPYVPQKPTGVGQGSVPPPISPDWR